MNNNMIKSASVELTEVANKLARKGVAHAETVYKIAQALQDLENGSFDPSGIINPEQSATQDFDPSQGDMEQNFDPSQEIGGNDMVKPFASDSEVSMETKVPIESFAQVPEKAPMSNVNVHTCTVTFKAHPDVKESDMMNFILGIGDKLGVEVDSFKWAKIYQKINSGK